MLSIENLREHCRTCLSILDKSIENEGPESIRINKYPDVEHLIDFCCCNATVDSKSLCFYVPFICSSCFEKWFEFSKLYRQAINTDADIRKILEEEMLKPRNINEQLAKPVQEGNIKEFSVNSETLVDIHEIEKYEPNSSITIDIVPVHSNYQINTASTYDDLKQTNNENELTIINSKLLEIRDECAISTCNSDNSIDDIELLYDDGKTQRVFHKVKNKQITKKSSSILKKRCKTRSNLQQASEVQQVRYECEQCNKYFWQKIKYDGHMKQVHEGIDRAYECQECNKAYNLYRTLLQHKQDCHGEQSEKRYNCDKCDKSFKTKVNLKRHFKKKHCEQKEPLRSICEQCGFTTAHQHSLSRHIKYKHKESDQLKCEQCPKVFKTRYSLKLHVLGSHNPSNIKPFKCSDCQATFTGKKLLNQHKLTHVKYNERMKCDFEGCEIRFAKLSNKTHHMRLVHLKVKKHICDFCGEAFGAMQTLRNHRYIHTGEKPYKCNVCGQGFRQRTSMENHRKTHFRKEVEKQDVMNSLPEINLNL